MKHLIVYLLLMSAFAISCAPDNSFDFPKEWTRDFSIIAYSGGGMKDEATDITITYDTCKFVQREGTILLTKTFALTEVDRTAILKKMKKLKLGEMKVSPRMEVVLDQGSSGICFHRDKEFCITDNSVFASKGDEKNYSIAYQYLTDFANQAMKPGPVEDDD